MKKIILSLILLFPIIAKAQCTNKDLTRYKTLAGNMTSYYTYNSENNTFAATIENVHSDLYIRDRTYNNEYRTNQQGLNEITLYNLAPGKAVTIKAYPTSGECAGYAVYTMYINVPYYNQYYSDPICNNNDNQLCSKWANTTAFTYEQFVETVERTTDEKIEEEKEREEYEEPYRFLNFLSDYYIYILLTIIIIGSYAIYKLDKKNKFDF